MIPRLKRYKGFIDNEYVPRLERSKEYEIGVIHDAIRKKVDAHAYDTILFTGMGCSAIVSDLIKGLFAHKRIPLHVEVINDYEIDYLLDTDELARGKTLVIISSYSGHSKEPIRAYHRLKRHTDDIIFLTSGGRLGSISEKENVSIIYWRLVDPDREYPLFHAPQYLSIMLDIFYRMGLIDTNYEKEIHEAARYVEERFTEQEELTAQALAEQLHGHNVILIANPKWYLSLLKLAKMHINEIAMAPCHRNYIHEFGHSEVATLTSPKQKQAVWFFIDGDDDDYTKEKVDTMTALLTKEVPQNEHVTVAKTRLDQDGFFKQLFFTLQFVQYTSYFLGVLSGHESRELISTAAGNPWYNQATIRKESAEQ